MTHDTECHVSFIWTDKDMMTDLSKDKSNSIMPFGITKTVHSELTPLPSLTLDKMAAILQTFSKAFSWMKVLYFDKNFTQVYSQGPNWQ